MNYGLYLSAASLQVNQQRQAVIANNLANAQTSSFKQDLAVVKGRYPAPTEWQMPPKMVFPLLDRMGGGLTSGGTHIDFSQGALTETGGDLDLALGGPGFFKVQVDGETRYSRDGRFTLNEQGRLVTVAGGHTVLDANGLAIDLPGGPATVDQTGRIRTNAGSVQLAVVNLDDPRALIKAGENTYRLAGAANEISAEGPVLQGYVEGSGVDPVRSLVSMIEVQRAYGASARMIRIADQMLQRAVNDLARLP